jgi:hypothetical protein
MPRRKPEPPDLDPARHPQDRLAQLFQRNGYIRAPSEERRRELGPRYKKGWEVRLALTSRAELDEVRRLLREMGLGPAKPFRKATQWVQPVYGRKAVDIFEGWSGQVAADRHHPAGGSP